MADVIPMIFEEDEMDDELQAFAARCAADDKQEIKKSILKHFKFIF